MRSAIGTRVACSLIMAAALAGPGRAADTGRAVVSLDGTWRVAESLSEAEMPQSFGREAPVPGLVNLAEPTFPDVDAFISRENMANKIRAKLAPESWLKEYWAGKVEQARNYFWYRKTFRLPGEREVALLKVGKAQFGTAVWLNGVKLGEYAGCFTASYYDLRPAIRWVGENVLTVRVGAHPAVLPDTYPTGSDFEKIKWTPGIYDSVSVILCDNPVIESVQVAPRVASGEVVICTCVRNRSSAPALAQVGQTVRSVKRARVAGVAAPLAVALQPGEALAVTQTVKVADAHLWSPEDPYLYAVETATGGDAVTTRFGMREFRFDAASKRAWLNGKVYYLRGSNITLHRFFEDPLCKALPWDEKWVRKLLGDIPKRMHWNYFRFCIGPVPDKWLDICDEVGLLIQNEFFVWTGGPGWYKNYSRAHDSSEMIRQYKDWMRDNWNHPSVAVWDANNETKDASFGETIIPAVRGLDLSGRPWENSYNKPAAPDDPVEHHPYLMISGYRGKLSFQMSDLEKMDGCPKPGQLPSDTNPALVNEYGWLWLNRDGSPTLLTENVYAQLMGANVTARQRLDLYAYLLAAKTEFWRAHRQYAGIVHFVYLTCSYPGVYTADHFSDVTRLTLDPAFADYMGEAFKPLGVYVNFFQPALKAGEARAFDVFLVNDYAEPVAGALRLTLEDGEGRALCSAESPFSLAALGDGRVSVTLAVPAEAAGPCVLKASARAGRGGREKPTLSRRWVTVLR
jgi:hypothetical protein